MGAWTSAIAAVAEIAASARISAMDEPMRFKRCSPLSLISGEADAPPLNWFYVRRARAGD
jgi:hypothetical protein